MRRLTFFSLSVALAASSLFVASHGQAREPAHAPPKTAAQPHTFAHAVVVAAEPDAANAGLKVLKAGGSAVDAAIAIQAVLGLEEPQANGLGGGAFMVYYDARTRRTVVYNGREQAPAAASPDLFVGEDGKTLSFTQAVLSGRSTGSPGVVAMLALAHRQHGRLPWGRLFSDAEQLARRGFVVPGRMGAAINGDWPQAKAPDAVAYFTKPGGGRFKAGDVMVNAAYADTLQTIATQGSRGFYSGRIAADIVAKVHEGQNASSMTLQDLAAYRPAVTEPLCRPYRTLKVCTTPPPAGGMGVLELLGLLSNTDIAQRGPDDPQSWALFAQASRLMYIDRDVYEGDPDFVTNPVRGLLAPDYLAGRAKLIPQLGAGAPAPGRPAGAAALNADATAEPGGTSHFVVVDRHGDVLSMTTTVENIFGSGRMVDGFFLNNQLTDFSFGPTAPGGARAANSPGPRKRPRSSMSPVIVFDAKGRVQAALGSPGGSSIIAYVSKALIGYIDWKLPLQTAIDLPNLVARDGEIAVEHVDDEAVIARLRATGASVLPDSGEISGLNGMVRARSGYQGAADPRREGVAIGY